MPMGAAVLVFAVTLVISVLSPFAVKPLLIKLHIMDVPNERSSHQGVVIRGLGLAVLAAMTVGYLVSRAYTDQLALVAVALTAIAAGFLGLSEDLRGVSVNVRSVFLLVIAICSALGLAQVGDVQWWFIVYAVLFLSGYINVANFMDGLNGMSGLHGIIAGVTFLLAGVFAQLDWLVFAGAVLAAGFAGFLPWNLSRPGAFLGDVGSYLLGGAVAATSLYALVSGVPILASIGPMIIYFGDVGVTLVKRVRAGHKWHEPHREHVYERIQQKGYGHIGSSLLTAGFSAAAAALGLMSFALAPIWWLVLLAAGLALVVLYVRLPKLLKDRDTPGLH